MSKCFWKGFYRNEIIRLLYQGFGISGIRLNFQVFAGSGIGIEDSFTRCSGSGMPDCRPLDSGAPVVSKVATSLVLVGITTFGHGCAQTTRPNIFTKPLYHKPWIQNSIRDLHDATSTTTTTTTTTTIPTTTKATTTTPRPALMANYAPNCESPFDVLDRLGVIIENKSTLFRSMFILFRNNQ